MSQASDQDIADLDYVLSMDGEWINIRRLFGTQMIPVSVRCRASVRTISGSELESGINQEQSDVILSPSQIIAAGWPGPWTPSANEPINLGTDRRVPRKGDKAVIKNRVRNIEVAMPIYVDDDLVRINLRVLG
jgi:hypothetical protein